MVKRKGRWLSFRVNAKCFICGSSVFPGSPLTPYDAVVHSYAKTSMLLIKYSGKEWFIGVDVSGKTICRKCLALLIALEGYYDCFYHHLIDNSEAVEIVKTILKNKQLLNEAVKYLRKKSYFPHNFVEKIKREFLKVA